MTVENAHTNRALFKAVQITPESIKDAGDWVLSEVGRDYVYGHGTPDSPLQFSGENDDDWDNPHFAYGRGAIFGDWLVQTDGGYFFFMEQDAFELLFDVENPSRVCPECRYIRPKHEGPGIPVTSTAVYHSTKCPSLAWMDTVKAGDEHPKGRGFIYDRSWHDLLLR